MEFLKRQDMPWSKKIDGAMVSQKGSGEFGLI